MKKSDKKMRIVLSIIAALLALIITVIIVFRYYTAGLKQVQVSDEEFGITTAEEEQSETTSKIEEKTDEIVNIVFLGIDKEENRSDVIMVLSINKTKSVFNVISILRDTKTTIEGCPWDTKINFAYTLGGSVLAVKTINQSFGTEFNQYLTMSFDNIIEIVDHIGGVDIELTAEEAKIVNSGAVAYGYKEQDAFEGLNHLNGAQALSFSRIRSIDSDYYRASRQQKVLEAMFNRVKEMSKTKYPELIRLVLNSVETTLTYEDMWNLSLMDLRKLKIVKNTIPDVQYEPGLWGGLETIQDWYPTENGPKYDTHWVWIYDMKKAGERLKSIISGKNN